MTHDHDVALYLKRTHSAEGWYHNYVSFVRIPNERKEMLHLLEEVEGEDASEDSSRSDKRMNFLLLLGASSGGAILLSTGGPSPSAISDTLFLSLIRIHPDLPSFWHFFWPYATHISPHRYPLPPWSVDLQFPPSRSEWLWVADNR